ncbi:MAG TPA: hypothetical protein IAC66_05725 [Candidatus Aphodousia gallistercoris]|nr:hypothetical protein [Candidatus Aphodousia gallistercoris]
MKLISVLVVGLCCSIGFSAQASSGNPTPEELGWEAGVVAPSPLLPRYSEPLFKTVQEGEEAKALAEEELQRIEKLRQGHRHLCGQKIFVNSCINKAEKVLKERERIAQQLIRTADHQIRMIQTQKRQAERNTEPPQPAKRGQVQREVKEASMPANRAGVTGEVTREEQEQANVQAYEAKQQEQAARKAELLKQAEARKAKREARQARYEEDMKKRAQAQQQQSEQSGSVIPFFK